MSEEAKNASRHATLAGARSLADARRWRDFWEREGAKWRSILATVDASIERVRYLRAANPDDAAFYTAALAEFALKRGVAAANVAWMDAERAAEVAREAELLAGGAGRVLDLDDLRKRRSVALGDDPSASTPAASPTGGDGGADA
jgi:hypothetical protein